MARPTIPFEESATHEVYEAYRSYVLQENSPEKIEERQGRYFFPNPHAFWEKILVPQLGYDMPWGSFQYHWQRLQIKRNPVTGEPYIIVDEVTKAVTMPEMNLIQRNELQRMKSELTRLRGLLGEKDDLRNLP
jgi:hypothetical protein